MSALFERWTGLALAEPAWLLLTLVVPLALLARARRGGPALRFSLAPLHAGEDETGAAWPRPWRTRLTWLPAALAALGMVGLVVALARPVARETVTHEVEGVDILFCLDASSSMTAADMEATRTRLDVAREAALSFLAGRPTDRVGLVAFARYPELLCPPTLDHDALTHILEDVGTVAAEGPEDATGIGTAVALAAGTLGRSHAASRVVILLTDGEENVATTDAPDEIAPTHAAQLAQALEVKVHAILAGTGRAGPGGTWTPPDTRVLEDLALQTGGSFASAPDAASIAVVYERIDAMERAPFEEPEPVFRDRYLPFLAAGLALLLLGRLLGATILAVLP